MDESKEILQLKFLDFEDLPWKIKTISTKLQKITSDEFDWTLNFIELGDKRNIVLQRFAKSRGKF